VNDARDDSAIGLDLCVPIETRTLGGKEVHAVGDGVLMVCLAEKVERNNVEALAQGIVDWHSALAPASDTTCVFRDSAFADDVAKTNMAAILEHHAAPRGALRRRGDRGGDNL
jgi:adenine-specific DNA-methyltransferase